MGNKGGMAALTLHLANRITKNKSTIVRLTIIFMLLVIIVYLLSPANSDNHSLSNSISSYYSSYVGPSRPLDPKYEKIFRELNPVVPGWGEDGQPVILSEEEDVKAKEVFSKAAFNVYASDRISPNRSVPDVRPPECSKVQYNIHELGNASIVIIFTNEIWSALIRTIWSVINRTPSRLLHEIILVDDFSDRPELKEPLDKYVQYYFPSLVKIIRLEKRSGLITARLAGAKLATGSTLVFLDSHIETTKGWMEPLLKTVEDDHRNVVCPVIDIISDKNMEYVNNGSPYYFQVGGFIWSGHFIWLDVNEDLLKKHPTKPVKSPTMAGGLFAINREYFFASGSYDEKMEIWGGENLEMSFRLWQCGGKIFIHGCSHVGHIFRDYHPYSFLGKDTHAINTIRTVKVWMDDYQRYFFLHRKELRQKAKTIDVEARLKLRESLGCKSFRWYLENIYTEKKYIYDQDVKAYGGVRNPISSLCLDNLNKAEDAAHDIAVYKCIESALDEWTNQMFSFRNNGEIRREETCLSVDQSTNTVRMLKCINLRNVSATKRRRAQIRKKYQLWEHTKGGVIRNVKTGQCLTAAGLDSESNLSIDNCNPEDAYQIWWFQKYMDVDVKLISD